MLRLVIIGCGVASANSHAAQIQREAARLLASRDREPLMATSSFRSGFRLGGTSAIAVECCGWPGWTLFTSLPPRATFRSPRSASSTETDVYVEKPFTVDAAEALRLLACDDRLQATNLATTTSSRMSHGGCARWCAAAISASSRCTWRATTATT